MYWVVPGCFVYWVVPGYAKFYFNFSRLLFLSHFFTILFLFMIFCPKIIKFILINSIFPIPYLKDNLFFRAKKAGKEEEETREDNFRYLWSLRPGAGTLHGSWSRNQNYRYTRAYAASTGLIFMVEYLTIYISNCQNPICIRPIQV